MSTAIAEPQINEKQNKIIHYLENEVEKGKLYFKSKFMSDDLEMSAKEIGSNMLKLAETCDKLEIEKWSYASATTWKVEKPN